MNRIYGSCTGLLVCLLLCTCAGQEPLSPDGLIRLGTRAGGYEGSATRASVNDLAGLAGRQGRRVWSGYYAYGCLVCPADVRMERNSFDGQRADYGD